MRSGGLLLLLAAEASALQTGVLPRARGAALQAARAHGAAMIIEPELYRECAIYDYEMEAQMAELQDAIASAEQAAEAAQGQMDLVMREKDSMEATLS